MRWLELHLQWVGLSELPYLMVITNLKGHKLSLKGHISVLKQLNYFCIGKKTLQLIQMIYKYGVLWDHLITSFWNFSLWQDKCFLRSLSGLNNTLLSAINRQEPSFKIIIQNSSKYMKKNNITYNNIHKNKVITIFIRIK